jgi:GMC oxidoreductase
MVLSKDFLKSYDVIMVGSGFASLPVVTHLKRNIKILIITGGDKSETPPYRELTESEGYGHFPAGYFAAHWARQFGGTSSRWNGWIATLDPRDFEGSRSLDKWPINFNDLAPYYLSAAQILGRNPIAVQFQKPVSNGTFIYKPFSHALPTRLLDKYNQIRDYPNVDLLESFQLTRLITKTRTSIDALVLCNADGRQQIFPLSNRQKVVLACGGLGNAQILLQPNEGSSIAVGNESGVVGKYLMEHPHAKTADLLIDPSLIPTLPDNFGDHTPAFILSDNIVRSHNLLGCTLAVDNGEFEVDFNFQNYFEKKFGKKLVKRILFARSEQEPSVLNSVALTPERNWAGLHKLRTQCAFSTRDLWSIEQTTRLFGDMLTGLGYGVLKIDNSAIYRNALGGGHTMGTTRMGSNPKTSVCNSQNRIHGYSNLYVSGSSVFTTGGASNPTLTIVALAIRLSDILNRDFRAQS